MLPHDELLHYGVKGMKWHVKKKRDPKKLLADLSWNNKTLTREERKKAKLAAQKELEKDLAGAKNKDDVYEQALEEGRQLRGGNKLYNRNRDMFISKVTKKSMSKAEKEKAAAKYDADTAKRAYILAYKFKMAKKAKKKK